MTLYRERKPQLQFEAMEVPAPGQELAKSFFDAWLKSNKIQTVTYDATGKCYIMASGGSLTVTPGDMMVKDPRSEYIAPYSRTEFDLNFAPIEDGEFVLVLMSDAYKSQLDQVATAVAKAQREFDTKIVSDLILKLAQSNDSARIALTELVAIYRKAPMVGLTMQFNHPENTRAEVPS